MKKTGLILSALLFISLHIAAQDEDKNRLEISGSVDTYYKYDFSGYIKDDGTSNIPTSFADEQNSISIGMVDIALSQTVGRASFVGEIAFGPRSFKSIPLFKPENTNDDIYVGIQNLYVSYAFTDFFSLTAGYMGTFVGYEVISPAANFNYSTSYLFTNGPFQNAGIKADFTFSDRFAVMIGMFNDWNVYEDFNGVSDFGAQVYVAPVDGWDVYLNFLTGKPSGTIVDITTGWQINDLFYLGLNAADYTVADKNGGFTGVALYPQVSLSDAVSLGLRYEYFKYKDYTDESNVTVSGDHVNAFTLTANLKAGPLTVLPELRLDAVSDELFYGDPSGYDPAASATQFLIAAVYAF